jgi:beta-phosphoglucomutase
MISGGSRIPQENTSVTQEHRAVIWDVDGTLIDSSDAHWHSWRAIFQQEGYPDIDHATHLAWFGRRNEEILREYFGPDATEEMIFRIAEMKEAHYREGLKLGPTPVLPGVNDWLTWLAAEGWKLGISSSAATRNLEIILPQSGWSETFGAVVAREDVRKGKPDPEVFLIAAARLGVDPARAIVIEDAAAGVLGAHRAGMRTIGVGAHHADLGAMLSVSSLDQLPGDAFDALLAQPMTVGIM